MECLWTFRKLKNKNLKKTWEVAVLQDEGKKNAFFFCFQNNFYNLYFHFLFLDHRHIESVTVAHRHHAEIVQLLEAEVELHHGIADAAHAHVLALFHRDHLDKFFILFTFGEYFFFVFSHSFIQTISLVLFHISFFE